MSSIKTRKHFVILDMAFSGLWAFMYFVVFCYMCYAWYPLLWTSIFSSLTNIHLTGVTATRCSVSQVQTLLGQFSLHSYPSFHGYLLFRLTSCLFKRLFSIFFRLDALVLPSNATRLAPLPLSLRESGTLTVPCQTDNISLIRVALTTVAITKPRSTNKVMSSPDSKRKRT